MDVGLIFKIATVGILIAILDKILDGMGKKEQATLVTLSGLIIVLMMVLGLINRLFDNVKAMFQF